MTTQRHEIITEDGIRLHVTVRGPADAPVTVALLHCWTADEADWHYQVPELLARFGNRIRLLTWDHRGHGRSEACPEAACSLTNLAKDTGLVLDTYASDGPIVLAGHSIGGMTISTLPDVRPDLVRRIAGLAFVSTSSGGLDDVTLGLPAPIAALARRRLPLMLATRARTITKAQRRRVPLVERQVVRRFLFGRPLLQRDLNLVVDQLINCPPSTMSGFLDDMLYNHERTEELAAFNGIPTTVLVGTRDLLTPPDHARRLAAAVSGARLLVSPGAGHMLPLERHELVSDELCSLVERALATSVPQESQPA